MRTPLSFDNVEKPVENFYIKKGDKIWIKELKIQVLNLLLEKLI